MDRNWSFIWVTSWFLCPLSYSQGMFNYPEKTKISFKTKPNPKSPNDPWWLCNLSLIWFEMTCKIDLWHIRELNWNKKLAYVRIIQLWENFLWGSLETKCELILIPFGSVNFIFCAFIFHCCILKNIVLINLEIDSLQSMFIVYLKHIYFTLILLLFVVFYTLLEDKQDSRLVE